MPPVQRGGITVEQGVDGRLIHTYRQSTLGELDVCPERGRLTLTGAMPRIETDAAALGTGMHLGFEEALIARDAGDYMTIAEIADVMTAEYQRIKALPNFEAAKGYRDDTVARKHLQIATHWFHTYYASLEPLAMELPFNGLAVHEDEHRVILINGTIDLIDKHLGACDWKSTGHDDAYLPGFGGKAWEKQRWAVQPTVYSLALELLGWVVPPTFTYLVYVISGSQVQHQTLPVDRHSGDHAWLVDRLVAYSVMVEAELGVWPKQDNHALCSEAWCPAWDQCKGRHYVGGWPKVNQPVMVTPT